MSPGYEPGFCARVLRPGSAPGFCARADKAGWPAARLLAAPAELEPAEPELAERERRRIQRHLVEARLPPGKTLDAFDFTLVPTLGKARPMALVEGDAWLKTGRILLAFGPPGAGKSHAAAGSGDELVRRGYRVFCTGTTDLVQRLQVARQALTLTQEIAKRDRFDLPILGDLSHVRKDQAETSVLFELVSARHERRSITIAANQPFSGWGAVFPDRAMTVAAIDRLVHHADSFGMNVESHRRRTALRAATSARDTADDAAGDTEKED